MLKNEESGMVNVIAHIARDGRVQSLVTHSLQTANLSKNFGEIINLKSVAKITGLVHDIGKATVDFQSYICNENGKRGSVKHAPYGAVIIYDLYHNSYPLVSEIISNVVYTHHNSNGEMDFITPDYREEFIDKIMGNLRNLKYLNYVMEYLFTYVILKEDLNKLMLSADKEISVFLEKCANKQEEQKVLFYLNRFISSCLIDGDRSNTIAFEKNGYKDYEVPNYQEYFQKKYSKLIEKISLFENDTKLNQLRSEISDRLDEKANDSDGIHQLSVPTGGGKTLASFRYGLKKCVKHNKKRIIYIIPYTSIIEQNAQVMRNIIDEHPDDLNLILEHHSNIATDDEETDRIRRAELVQTNWDAPIIVTTVVQFANAVWAGKTSMSRRFHNLTDSVIIFDEIQNIPDKMLTVFTQAINWLSKFGKSDIVLCTATQPPLKEIDSTLTYDQLVTGLFDNNEFDRVNIVDDTTKYIRSEEEFGDYIIRKSQKHSSVLAIANTKAVVAETFKVVKTKVSENVKVYHLSTSMTASHRKSVISEIKYNLKQKKKVICITTPLIEAGVDISFEGVVRSLTGLDSIAQAAGRCNRNNEAGNAKGTVYLVCLDSNFEKLDKLATIKRRASKTENMLVRMDNPNSLLKEDIITHFFKEYYQDAKKDFDINGVELSHYVDGIRVVKKFCEVNGKIPVAHQFFSPRTVGRNVKVIDQDTVGLIVPYNDEAKEIIANLNSRTMNIGNIKRELQKAQIYTVNVFQNTLSKYKDAVYRLEDVEGVYAVHEQFYDMELGLCAEPVGQMDSYIF